MTIVAITPPTFSDHLGRSPDDPHEMRISIPLHTRVKRLWSFIACCANGADSAEPWFGSAKMGADHSFLLTHLTGRFLRDDESGAVE